MDGEAHPQVLLLLLKPISLYLEGQLGGPVVVEGNEIVAEEVAAALVRIHEGTLEYHFFLVDLEVIGVVLSLNGHLVVLLFVVVEHSLFPKIQGHSVLIMFKLLESLAIKMSDSAFTVGVVISISDAVESFLSEVVCHASDQPLQPKSLLLTHILPHLKDVLFLAYDEVVLPVVDGSSYLVFYQGLGIFLLIFKSSDTMGCSFTLLGNSCATGFNLVCFNHLVFLLNLDR